jgi:hypothetical protein
LRQLATRFDVRLPTFGDDRARVAAMSKGDDGGGARPPLREVADAAWKLLGLAGGEEERRRRTRRRRRRRRRAAASSVEGDYELYTPS